MSETIHASISTDFLNIPDAYDFVSDPAHGAVDVFVGVVRNHHEGSKVQGITYDVHDALAIKTFKEIAAEAKNKWAKIKIYISHYKGELDIGGISIIIAVSSAHRAESFEACRYIIEELKKRSPVWKKEHYPEEKSEWLPGHSLRVTANG
jgi:molybdopterin synthase catalytic subunit